MCCFVELILSCPTDYTGENPHTQRTTHIVQCGSTDICIGTETLGMSNVDDLPWQLFQPIDAHGVVCQDCANRLLTTAEEMEEDMEKVHADILQMCQDLDWLSLQGDISATKRKGQQKGINRVEQKRPIRGFVPSRIPQPIRENSGAEPRLDAEPEPKLTEDDAVTVKHPSHVEPEFPEIDFNRLSLADSELSEFESLNGNRLWRAESEVEVTEFDSAIVKRLSRAKPNIARLTRQRTIIDFKSICSSGPCNGLVAINSHGERGEFCQRHTCGALDAWDCLHDNMTITARQGSGLKKRLCIAHTCDVYGCDKIVCFRDTIFCANHIERDPVKRTILRRGAEKEVNRFSAATDYGNREATVEHEYV